MPVPLGKFEADLEASQAGVREFSRQIASRGATNIILGDTKEFDVKWTQGKEVFTCEIKEDLLAEKTGNVAIEVSSRGKASGLSTTTADYYVYLIMGHFYMIKTEKLHAEIIRYNFRLVKGGDDNTSELYLIPLIKFCALCKPIFTNIPPYLLSQFKL